MKPSRLFRLHFLTFLNDCERTFVVTYKERKDFKGYKKASLMAIEKELSAFLDAPWVNEDQCKGLKIYLGELQDYLNDSQKEQIKEEIAHIFESGANEVRIFNMVEQLITKIGRTPPLVPRNAPQVQMPQKLTAEGGHKYLLTGEFYVEKEIEIETCTCEGECEDCMSIEFAEMEDMVNIERIPIPWSTMKDIYNRVAAFEGHKQALNPLGEAYRLLSEDEKETKIGKELFEKIKHHRMELKKLTD